VLVLFSRIISVDDVERGTLKVCCSLCRLTLLLLSKFVRWAMCSTLALRDLDSARDAPVVGSKILLLGKSAL
jgi:hypothetical protein